MNFPELYKKTEDNNKLIKLKITVNKARIQLRFKIAGEKDKIVLIVVDDDTDPKLKAKEVFNKHKIDGWTENILDI